MNWPWVSRTAFELLQNENAFLRQQNQELLAHRRKIERREAGMSEDPRLVAERQAREDIPSSVLRMIAGYDSEHMRAAIEEDVRRARAAGTPWAEIERLLSEEGDGDDVIVQQSEVLTPF